MCALVRVRGARTLLVRERSGDAQREKSGDAHRERRAGVVGVHRKRRTGVVGVRLVPRAWGGAYTGMRAAARRAL